MLVPRYSKTIQRNESFAGVFFFEAHRKLHIITAVDNAFPPLSFSRLLINDFLSDCREC